MSMTRKPMIDRCSDVLNKSKVMMMIFVLPSSQVHKNGNQAGDHYYLNETHIFRPTLQMFLQKIGNCNTCKWLLTSLNKRVQLRRYRVFCKQNVLYLIFSRIDVRDLGRKAEHLEAFRLTARYWRL
jgi:hypothetical protein